MILVTGATGALGSAVVARLLRRTSSDQVAALVRDEARATDLAAAGVTLRVGDYDDVTALDAAMAGVETVVLVASNEPDHRVAQHQNVIDAAVRARVGLLAFASRAMNDVEASKNTLMGHYAETDRRIAASGLRHVIFRNALYLDTVPLYVGGPRVFEAGINLPTRDGKVAWALRREQGEAIANAVLDHEGGSRTWTLAAPWAAGFGDVAAALTRVSGRDVTYTPVTDEQFTAAFVAGGGQEVVARRIIGFYDDVRDGQLDETSDDMTTLLGRAPVTLEEGLRELFAL